jgi:hypothetical protein
MSRLICVVCALSLLAAGAVTTAKAEIIQVALIVDASSSTESELPVFRAGVAGGIGILPTDGSVELTLVQFSATAAVLVDALLIDSPADRAFAVAQANSIDPAVTDVPPFQGGTNFEDGFLKATDAVTGSPLFGQAGLQWYNMLTDGNPTAHNHWSTADLDEETRKARARAFGVDARDAAIAAGVDNISFEVLDPPVDPLAGIPYLETLTYPGAPFTVAGDPPVFPDPIQSQGFIFQIGSVDDIESALTAKFEAAGIPEPITLGMVLVGSVAVLFRRRPATRKP